MFPKRLFLTALGALGLGALASGPAYSQQLPAPDLFDEITRCSPTLPHGGMGNASGLDARGYIPLAGNNVPGDAALDDAQFEMAFTAAGALRFQPTTDSDVASTGVSLILDKFGELETELKKWKDFEALKKKEYIDNLAAEIGVDPVTGMGTEDNGMSRIANNETRGMDNATAIAAHAGVIATNAENIKTNADNIMAEQTARVEADMMLAEGVDANKMTGMANMEAIAMNKDMIGTNHGAIMALDGRVGANESAIMRNSGMIGESAFAVGFQVAGEQASFQVGIASSGGETGASAGAGFQF